MNNAKLKEWEERYSKVNVFQEFDEIKEFLKNEYLEDNIKPFIISYSGGKDSSLVLTLVWQMIMKLPTDLLKREIHVVMSDAAAETPVMSRYQRGIMKIIETTVVEQKLDHIFKVHLVKPSIKGRFFFRTLGRGYPPATPNSRTRPCTFHMKILPIQRLLNEIINQTIQKQDCFSENSYAITSILGVRTSESVSRAESMKKHSVEDFYAKHATDDRIRVMHPIKNIELDALWSYLLALPNGEFPYGGNVSDMMKMYGKTGHECSITEGSQGGVGASCGQVGSRTGCFTCPLAGKNDKMLSAMIDEGYTNYSYLQEWKNYMLDIRNDVRFRLPTQRQKFNKHQKKAELSKDDFSLFSIDCIEDSQQRRLHRYETFNKATFNYAPGGFTIEARKRMLEYLLWTQNKIGEELIEDEELQAIYQTWKEDGYDIDPKDVIPNRYKHDEKLILLPDGSVNEKESTVTSFPLFYVQVQTQFNDFEFVTYVQNKVKETNKSIHYFSKSMDCQEHQMAFNEYTFIVCSPFANTLQEAEHYVYSWLDWKDNFNSDLYDPPFEEWDSEVEGMYVPKLEEDQLAYSKTLSANRLIELIEHDLNIELIWKEDDYLLESGNLVKEMSYLDRVNLLLLRLKEVEENSKIQYSFPTFTENDYGQLGLAI
ncbi:phosphoadenosine phosphosulfate reductase family protein (plasmid) [Alkalihalobacillus hwajinpoensis]|uniref:phosphoadenosine phosphosulfate reductase domain-containing protein n=1 Tax=Guptibacillus hwajinpoensis TaxID=208199 RepID=UPI001883546B|nr:phosphoadenosine phosphosulfate reductase family protein [Pseudalkalibacillus hwajinpoensis]MBF0706724.1 phosphoadenosine phosphosulfate reductase family protein [Pseudalkalibacillus hwajinpoensis]